MNRRQTFYVMCKKISEFESKLNALVFVIYNVEINL